MRSNYFTKERTEEIVLWFLLVSPVVFIHMFDGISLSLSLAAVILGFYLCLRHAKKIPDTVTNRLSLAFGILWIVLLPFSLSAVHSLPKILEWFVYLGIFIYAQCVTRSASSLNRTLKVVTTLAGIVGLSAIYKFIGTGLVFYPRLDSIIAPHNIYGGFLIIPVFASFLFAFEGKRWKKVMWLVVAGFLVACLALTFSRGSWLSLIIGASVVLLIFKKRMNFSAKQFFIHGFCVLIIASFFAGGIWLLAGRTTRSQDHLSESKVSVEIFPENRNENAVVARLAYFKDAFYIFSHSPIFGFGAGSYSDALRLYKTDPNFMSARDPHNVLLRIVVEGGILAGTVYLALVMSIILFAYAILRKITDSQELIYLALFAGLGASLLHALMDADWFYFPLPVVFFGCAGALIGALQNENHNRSMGKQKHFSLGMSNFFIVFFILSSIVSIAILRANITRQVGFIYYANNRYGEAIEYYDKAIGQNPYEPKNWFNRSEAYFALGNYEKAREDLEEAVRLYPNFGLYHSALGQVDTVLNRQKDYEDDMLKSIRYYPASDLTDHMNLAYFYFNQKRYSEAQKVIERVVPSYTEYSKTMWFKSDPSHETITLNLSLLKSLAVTIEKSDDTRNMAE